MVKVLDIALYDEGFDKAIDTLLKVVQQDAHPESNCVSATGAHGIIEARRNEMFKKHLQEFYLNLPDGMPGVWVGRIKGARKMERCYGPDVFAAFMTRSADKPILHFFCGGKEGVAEELKVAAATRFGNRNIVGTFSPPFREMTDDELRGLAGMIHKSGAQVVWIGLSTPKQEVFAARLRKFIHVNLIITVGAVFDFYTGRARQAPRWMQRSGLEWFFRLSSEPKRLAGRYFEIVPKFIWFNIKEFIDFCISKTAVK